MPVTVAYDSSPGVQQWIVNKKIGQFKISDQTLHDNREEAIASARNLADEDENIILREKGGDVRLLYSGDGDNPK